MKFNIKRYNQFFENNTDIDLEKVCKSMGYTYSLYEAKIGNSKYYKINGYKFRLSNHYQPSHYQNKDYFEVDSDECILGIIQNDLFNFYANPIEIEGEYFNMLYDEKNDFFDKIKIDHIEYNELKNKMDKRDEFFIDNGWKGSLH